MQLSTCNKQTAYNFITNYQAYLNKPITTLGQTILMTVCSTSSFFIVQACINFNADTNIFDHLGRTALHYAAAVGNIHIFQLLINAGAKPYALTIGGETPLFKACLFCQGEIIEWYLNNEPNAFQIKDKMGRTPLNVLKLSGEELYNQVQQVYANLKAQIMIPQENME